MEKSFTPHLEARPEDIANTVIMPGDPLRAKAMAETLLDGAKLVNGVRNMLGYTGTFGGKRISVMSSGMGMPSMGIYSYELFNFYGVENIIRAGTAGSISKNVHICDVILAMSASTDSNFMHQFCLPGTYAASASFELLQKAVQCAKETDLAVHVGNVLTTDLFYTPKDVNQAWSDMGILAMEMECAALYATAARAGKNALGILSVSDELLTEKRLSAQERQESFAEMVRLALAVAVS